MSGATWGATAFASLVFMFYLRMWIKEWRYMSDRSRQRLVERIAKMVGEQTYNHAPVNYTIAEKAIEMAERHFRHAASKGQR